MSQPITPAVAAPSTLADLHLALKIRMAAIAATLPLLPTKGKEPAVDTDVPVARPADVIEFDTPPVQLGRERFPFICVRPLSGSDSPQGSVEVSSQSVGLIVGTYSDSDDGGVDVLLLIQAIRRSLGAEPTLAGTAFEHVGPLTWNTENLGAVRPQWLGEVVTNWTIPRPVRVASPPEA